MPRGFISAADIERLKSFAETDVEKTTLGLCLEHSSYVDVAGVLGVHRSSPPATIARIRKRAEEAARLGQAPGHFDSGTAPGYKMGKVTVQRGPDGEVRQTWERQSPEGADQLDAMMEALAAAADGIQAIEPAPRPAVAMKQLQTWYVAGDPHFGQLAWAREAGEDHDLQIARDRMISAVSHLLDSAPPSESAVLLNVGDAFHSNNSRNRTEGSGNVLDVDGRMSKIFEQTLATWAFCIDRLLTKHRRVECINIRGNHDPDVSLMLSYALRERYRNEERVSIPICDRKFQYRRFGATLICMHHGDGVKPDDLPGVMLADVPQDTGETEFRHWYLGHIHHKVKGREVSGCDWESFNTLAGRDAWHDGKGYRARQAMQAIVHHETDGEVARHTCDLIRIRRTAEDRAKAA